MIQLYGTDIAQCITEIKQNEFITEPRTGDLVRIYLNALLYKTSIEMLERYSKH